MGIYSHHDGNPINCLIIMKNSNIIITGDNNGKINVVDYTNKGTPI